MIIVEIKVRLNDCYLKSLYILYIWFKKGIMYLNCPAITNNDDVFNKFVKNNASEIYTWHPYTESQMCRKQRDPPFPILIDPVKNESRRPSIVFYHYRFE